MCRIPASNYDETKTVSYPTSPNSQPASITLTRDKIVPACSSMRDCSLKVTVRVENDPIRTRVAARVGPIGAKDGELLIGAGIRKAEAFVIGEGMRIVVAADGPAAVVIVAALVHGVIDIRLPVADTTAAVDACLTLCTDKPRMSHMRMRVLRKRCFQVERITLSRGLVSAVGLRASRRRN